MTVIDRDVLTRFLELAGRRLEGDWVMLGGTVLPLLGVPHRTTLDIDVAGPLDATNEQILALMDIALQLGLPVETINQAGAYFLHRIDGWRDNLVPLHHGPRATIHRPNVTLFVLLKTTRLSESDLADCLAFLRYARRHGEAPDEERLRRAIAELGAEAAASARRSERLRTLLEAI